MVIRSRIFWVLTALAGCTTGEGAIPLPEAAGDSLPPAIDRVPAVLVAVPTDGGRPSYYDVASLEKLPDVYTPVLPAFDEVWGIDVGTSTLVGVTADREGLSIDLDSGRRIGFAEGVLGGSLAANGVAAAVTNDGTIATFRRRSRRSYANPFGGDSVIARARHDGRVLILSGGDSARVALVGRDEETPEQSIGGTPILAPYSDRIVLLLENAVVLVDPAGRDASITFTVKAVPRAATFSPSGHQVYIVTDAPGLRVADRFRGKIGRPYSLEAPIDDIRIDPLGQYLLLHVEGSDSTLVLETAPLRRRTTVETAWSSTFPIISPDGVLLTRVDDRIVALELGTFDTLGSRDDASDSYWLVTTRLPGQDLATQSVDIADVETSESILTTEYFVQVASSQNEIWAEDLANSLVRDANLPAGVLPPDLPGEGYRVVIGPYASREAADDVGTSLSRPFWIYVREPLDSIQ